MSNPHCKLTIKLLLSCFVIYSTFSILNYLLFTGSNIKNLLNERRPQKYQPYPIIEAGGGLNISSENIAIVIILSKSHDRSYYQIAIDSVECYAKAHGYEFVLTNDSNFGCDHIKINIFRRHCVLAKILVDYEAVVHIDGDMGIVNPKRRIQEYMTESSDIVFYDRHFAPEVAMCYIVKNTEYAITLLNEFAEYERKLPNSSHGSENGALHIFLAEKLFPHNQIDIDVCRIAWENSWNIVDQFAYTHCIRAIFGASIDFDKIRILRKGTGFARDDWITGGVWSPERDFMLHGWKMRQLAPTPAGVVKAGAMSELIWYSPFLGSFDMEKCSMGNTTWYYNPSLIASRETVEVVLQQEDVISAARKVNYFYRLYKVITNSFWWYIYQSHVWKSDYPLYFLNE
ncbi:Nucleotide-diphospho-sugar transferase domain-containing protein [Caenorhabditis elegans]|uniref:Nucleotide-diphospho-sugar transferase domain-containing protein n=1 Tax=Caenorhabditis elegans TaxID=6239 RepID=O02232_CAEEL|nr:Nucleotide-diphospho-sugar transferase domain-containing protein [Caenorhabditis elegans]CAB05466.1 Nucleotide-diphospho-sugar transferase domain-containing protein [Caenorhabditis elegans]|eukprot:NP_493159.1 Uncharacterized protein CELE_C54C8.4 [Caenorhabditis elegans]